MAESKNFDIVGVFLSDYGLTGQNIALQILSNLDFSSLQNGLLVSETWNQFLTKDRTLWLKMLGKTQPLLEYLSNELSNGDEDECKVWQEFFDSLKMKDDIRFDKISRLFTKIMSMLAIIQEWGDENGYEVEGYYIPENLNDGYFGQILRGKQMSLLPPILEGRISNFHQIWEGFFPKIFSPNSLYSKKYHEYSSLRMFTLT